MESQRRSLKDGPLPGERRSLSEKKTRVANARFDSNGGAARALLASSPPPISGASSDGEAPYWRVPASLVSNASCRHGGGAGRSPLTSGSCELQGVDSFSSRGPREPPPLHPPPPPRRRSFVRRHLLHPRGSLTWYAEGEEETPSKEETNVFASPSPSRTSTLTCLVGQTDCADEESGQSVWMQTTNRSSASAPSSSLFKRHLLVRVEAAHCLEAPPLSSPVFGTSNLDVSREQRRDSLHASLERREEARGCGADEGLTGSASEKSGIEIRDDASAEQSTQTAESQDTHAGVLSDKALQRGSRKSAKQLHEGAAERRRGGVGDLLEEDENGHDEEEVSSSGVQETCHKAGEDTSPKSGFLCGPLNKCGYFRSRRSRRLCLLSLVLLLLLVVVVPIMLCVVAPSVVKMAVANTQFEVVYADVSRSGRSQLDVQLQLYLSKVPPVASQVEACTAKAFWRGEYLGLLEIPTLQMKRGVATLDMTTTLTVTDPDVWRRFASDFVQTGEASWVVKGEASVSALGFTFRKVPLVMKVPVRGPLLAAKDNMGQAPFRVLSIDMSRSDSSRIAFLAEVEFTNASPTAVENLGFVSFSLHFGGVCLGLIKSQEELSLKRGLNRYVFLGEIHPSSDLEGGACEASTAQRRGLEDNKKTSSFFTDASEGESGLGKNEAFLKALSELVSKSLSGQLAHVEALGTHCSDALFNPAVLATRVKAPMAKLYVAPRVPTAPVPALVLEALEGEALASNAEGEEDKAESLRPTRRPQVVSEGMNSASEEAFSQSSFSSSLSTSLFSSRPSSEAGGGRRPKPLFSSSSALSSLLEGLKLRDVQVLDSVAGGASSVDLKARVEARIANPLGRNAPLHIQHLTVKGQLLLEGFDNQLRIGTLTAYLSPVGVHEEVPHDAPLLGEEGFDAEATETQTMGGLSPESTERILEFTEEGEEDGEFEAKVANYPEGLRRQQRFGSLSEGRRLAEGPFSDVPSTRFSPPSSSSSSSFSVSNAVWLDVVFLLRGSLDLEEGASGFSELVRQMATDESVSLMLMRSKAEVVARLGFGSLRLDGVPLDNVMKFPGLSARATAVTIKELHVLQEETDPVARWIFKTTAQVFCPLPVKLSLGAVGIRLAYEGSSLGFLCTTSFELHQGINDLSFLGVLEPRGEDEETRVALLSRLFSAAVSDAPLKLRPHVEATLTYDPQNFVPLVPLLTSLSAEAFAYGALPDPPRVVKAAVEGLSLSLPIPSVGRASDFLSAAELQELRVFGGSSLRTASAASVPLDADLRVVMKNPLGASVELSVQRVDVNLRIASLLPAEASTVLTPSGERKVVEGQSLVKVKRWLGRVTTSVSQPVCSFMASLEASPPSSSSEDQAVGGFAFVELLSRLSTELRLEGAHGLDRFASFAAAFLQSDVVETEVQGRASCSLDTCFGKVEVSDMPLQLRVAMPALGGAREVSLSALELLGVGNVERFSKRGGVMEDASVSLSTESRGLLFRLRATLRNNSPLRMELGLMVLDLLYHGVRVGVLQSRPSSLLPGDVTFALAGGFFLNPLTEGPLSRMFTAALKGNSGESDEVRVRIAEVELADASGQSVSSPPWLAAALRGLEIRSPLPSLAEMLPTLDTSSMVENVAFNKVVLVSANFHTTAQEADALGEGALQLLADVSLEAQMPWTGDASSFSIRIIDVEFEALLLAGEDEEVGFLRSMPWLNDPLASAFLEESGFTQTEPQTWLSTGEEDAQGDEDRQMGSGRIAVRLPIRVSLKTRDGGATLSQWVRRFLADPQGPFVFVTRGVASVKVELDGVARLTLADIPLNVVVPLGGLMNSTNTTSSLTGGAAGGGSGGAKAFLFSPQVQNFTFNGRHPRGGLSFSAEAVMVNPTPFSMELPALLLEVSFRQVVLAELESLPALLHASPGETRVAVRGVVFQQATTQGQNALSDLVEMALKTVVLGEDGETEVSDEETSAAVTSSEASESQDNLLVRILEVRNVTTFEDSLNWGGTSSTANKTDSAPSWLSASLQGLEIEAPLDGRGLLPLNAVRSVSLLSTEVWLNQGNSPLRLRAVAALHIGEFFGADAEFSVNNLAIEGSLREASGAKRIMGFLSPLSPTEASSVPHSRGAVRSKPEAQSAQVEENAALEVEVGVALRVADAEAFADFASSALKEGLASCLVEGEASGTVQSPLGLIEIRRLKVRQTVAFGGGDALLTSLTQNVRVLNINLDSVSLDGSDGLDRISFTVDVKLGAGLPETGTEAPLEFHTEALAMSLVSEAGPEGSSDVVGLLFVSKASLGGGPHPLRISGELFDESTARRMGRRSFIAALMEDAVNGRPLGVRIVSLVRNDQTPRLYAGSSLIAEAAAVESPDWLCRVIENAELSPSITGLGATLELLRGLRLSELSVDVSSQNTIGLDALVEARIFSPLGPEVPLRLRQASAFVKLSSEACLGSEALSESTPALALVPIASLDLSSRSPEDQRQVGGELSVQLRLSRNQDALRLEGAGEAFACFLTSTFNGGASPTLHFEATVSASVETPFGLLEVEALTVEAGGEILDGMAGAAGALADLDLTIDGLSFSAPPQGTRGLSFAASLQLRLPVDISLSFGEVQLALLIPRGDASASAASLGSIRLPQLNLLRGRASLEAQGLVDPHSSDLSVVSEFVSAILAAAGSGPVWPEDTGEPSTVQRSSVSAPRVIVRGVSVQLPDGSAPPLWMRSAVRALRVEAALPSFAFLLGGMLEGVVVSDMCLISASNSRPKNSMSNASAASLEGGEVLLGAQVQVPLENPFGDGSPPLRVKRLGLEVALLRLESRSSKTAEKGEEGASVSSSTRRRLSDSSSSSSSDIPAVRVFALEEEAFGRAELVGRLSVASRETKTVELGEEARDGAASVFFRVPPTPLRFKDDGAAFARLAVAMLAGTDSDSTDVEVGVVGEASAEVETPLGALRLRRIPIRSRLWIQKLSLFEPAALRRMALSAMRDLSVSDLPESLRFASPSSRTPVPALSLRTNVEVAALPRGIRVELDAPLSFFISRRGKQLGVVVIPRVSLGSNEEVRRQTFSSEGGAARVPLRGVVWPDKSVSMEDVANAFLGEASLEVEVRGAPNASDAALFSPEGLALRLSRGVGDSPPPRWLRFVLQSLQFVTSVGGKTLEESHGADSSRLIATTQTGAVKANEMLKAVELEGVDVDMTGERNPVLEAAFAVLYVLPQQFRVRHSIKGVEGNLEIFPAEENAVALGQVSVQQIRVLSHETEPGSGSLREEQRYHRLVAEMGATEMRVYAGGEESFTRLMKSVVDSTEKVDVRVKGEVRVFVETVIGSLRINTEVDLLQSVEGLGGMNGNEFFQMSSMTVVGGDADYLDATARVALQMPDLSKSVIGVDLGPSAFDLALPVPRHALPFINQLDPEFVEGYVVREGGANSSLERDGGNADVASFQLTGQPVMDFEVRPVGESEGNEENKSGRTLIVAGVVNVPNLRIYSPAKLRRLGLSRQPEQLATAVLFAPPRTVDGMELKVGTRELMSRYINGQPSHVVVLSNAMTSQNALLQGFLKDFKVEVDIAGSDKPFIHEVLISVKLRGLAPFVEAVTVFENPTDVKIKFLYADLETFFQGGSLGKMEIDLRSNPDIIYPNRVNRSSPVVVKPQIKDGTFALLMKMLRHVAAGRGPKPSVEAKGVVIVDIEEFRATLDIDISGIELSVPMASLNVGVAPGL